MYQNFDTRGGQKDLMGHIIICVAIGLSMNEKQSRPTVMLRRQWLYCLLSLYRRTGAKGERGETYNGAKRYESTHAPSLPCHFDIKIVA